MTGGLLQLRAYGSENIYLNGNPEISFFRKVYKRHTNFAIENFRINYSGTNTMTEETNTTFNFKLKRYGNLLGATFLVIRLPTIYSSNEQQFQWIKNIGANIIESVSFYIGGQLITQMTGLTLHNHFRLAKPYATNLNYNQLIGQTSEITNPQMVNATTGATEYRWSQTATDGTKITPSIVGCDLHIPIPFFFSNQSGLYLPMVALQYVEVEMSVELRRISDLYTIIEDRKLYSNYAKRIKPDPVDSHQSIFNFIKETALKNAFHIHLDAEYVFLDNEELNQFAKLPQELLIEQVQYQRVFGIVDHITVDMKFLHPTKEMRFYMRKTDNASHFNEWSNLGNSDTYGESFIEGPLSASRYRTEFNLNNIRQQMVTDLSLANPQILRTAKFLMNGQDRTQTFDERYWRLVQPFQYHLGSTVYQFNENDDYNVFSYGIEPDNFQPSGSCNLTNLKSYQLELYTQLPPLAQQWFLAYYTIELANTAYNSNWRNPNYSSLATINNIYTQLFTVSSIQTIGAGTPTPLQIINKVTPMRAIVWATYTIPSLMKFYVKIEEATYEAKQDGTIVDNTITMTGAKMYFYRDEAYTYFYMEQVITLGLFQVAYQNVPISPLFTLDFFNLNMNTNSFDTYFASIDQTLYNSLVDLLGTSISNYKALYKTLDDIIQTQINNQIAGDNMVQTENIFTLTFVDFTNNRIYGVLRVIQYVTDPVTNNVTKSDVSYWCVMTFSVFVSSGNYYVIELSNSTITLYDLTDVNLSTPITNFPQQILEYSIIVLQMTNTNNENPDNLKNYLWKYDLFIEAHNYNLLRIINGTGSLAYSS